jgi:type II secretory pathway predicted ATPase ExeA
MILLRNMIRVAGISIQEFGQMTGYRRSMIHLFLSGKRPMTDGQKRQFETVVMDEPRLSCQLNGHDVSVIWDEAVKRGHHPVDMGERLKRVFEQGPALVLGDPFEIKKHKETMMITGRALKHFKMIRNPFVNEIMDARDIFMGEEHRFLKEMMLDAARYGGFVAVSGEVGSGKSVMRKAVVHELAGEGIKIIYPVIIDKTRVTPASLVDAIIMDISDMRPKQRLEQKTRQALDLLRNRAASGMKQVLIIEEAHLLTRGAMKALKQIYELEDGFHRLVGIVLIGQPELRVLLDETQNMDMREVIRRITKAEISGLRGELPRYIEFKLKRVNRGMADVFADGAVDALDRRLMGFAGTSKKVSTSFPLSVNNLVARAMNMAVDMGEERVSPEIVMAC